MAETEDDNKPEELNPEETEALENAEEAEAEAEEEEQDKLEKLHLQEEEDKHTRQKLTK